MAAYTPELAEAHSGVPADEIRRIARRARDDRAGGGLRADRRVDPGVRHGLPVGDQRAEPASPATSTGSAGRCSPTRRSTRSATGLIGRRALRRLALPGPRAARGRRRAARRRPARGDRDARRRAGPRDADRGRQPGAVDARRRRRSTGPCPAWTSWSAIDIYLNETTRHADVILPPTTALERDHYDLVVPPAGGAQHGAVHPGGVPQVRRPAARLGDLPRGRAADHRAPARAAGPRCSKRLFRAGPAAPPRPPSSSTCCCGAAGPGCRYAGCAQTPAGVDLGPLRPGALPAPAADELRADRPRAAARAGRPRPARRRTPARPGRRTSCSSSAAVTSATATRGCTTPSGSPAASRATSSSCTPTTWPRAAWPTARPSRSPPTSARVVVEVDRHRRRHARRGQPPPRLRPRPRRQHAAWPAAARCPASPSTTSPIPRASTSPATPRSAACRCAWKRP